MLRKNLWSEKNLSQKKCLSEKNFVGKIFDWKIFWSRFFWSEKNLVGKIFWSEKNKLVGNCFDLEFFLCSDIFFWCENILGWKDPKLLLLVGPYSVFSILPQIGLKWCYVPKISFLDWGEGVLWPQFFLHIFSCWIKIRFHAENHLLVIFLLVG